MEKRYSVVKLLKNHLYPTYQLWAEMNSHKLSLQNGFKYGVLTVLSWLRERLGEGAEEQLNLPEAKDYAKVALEDLPSVHINHGFVIDIISLPEKGIWTMQITEPDLGPNPGTLNQSRPPVAGRIIETNVGFTFDKERVTLGVQTVISDPENSQLAEVYRPAFIRKLYLDDNFGLKQVMPITPVPYELNTQEQLEDFLQMQNNPEHQLPCVLFVEQKKLVAKPDCATYINMDDISKDLKGKFTGVFDHKFVGKIPDETMVGPVANLNSDEPLDLADVTVEYVPPFYDVERLAGSMAGYARVYVVSHKLIDSLAREYLEEVSCGDIVFVEPKCFGGLVTILSGSDIEENTTIIRGKVQNYIRGKAVDFGDVYFLGGARDALEQRTSELQQASAEQREQWNIEKEALEQRWQAKFDEKNRAISGLERQLHKCQQQAAAAQQGEKRAQEKLQRQLLKHIGDIAAKDEYISYLQRRLNRPHTKKELPDWLKENFGTHIVLHPRAVQLLNDADVNPERLELIYDALEFLGSDYWENRYGGLGDEEMNNRLSLKYQRGFLITQLRDGAIEAFKEQYMVPYAVGSKTVNKKLDFHLKIGNKAEHLVRIYFFHDEDNKLIVVGSLPEHLDSAKLG